MWGGGGGGRNHVLFQGRGRPCVRNLEGTAAAVAEYLEGQFDRQGQANGKVVSSWYLQPTIHPRPYPHAPTHTRIHTHTHKHTHTRRGSSATYTGCANPTNDPKGVWCALAKGQVRACVCVYGWVGWMCVYGWESVCVWVGGVDVCVWEAGWVCMGGWEGVCVWGGLACVGMGVWKHKGSKSHARLSLSREHTHKTHTICCFLTHTHTHTHDLSRPPTNPTHTQATATGTSWDYCPDACNPTTTTTGGTSSGAGGSSSGPAPSPAAAPSYPLRKDCGARAVTGLPTGCSCADSYNIGFDVSFLLLRFSVFMRPAVSCANLPKAQTTTSET